MLIYFIETPSHGHRQKTAPEDEAPRQNRQIHQAVQESRGQDQGQTAAARQTDRHRHGVGKESPRQVKSTSIPQSRPQGRLFYALPVYTFKKSFLN